MLPVVSLVSTAPTDPLTRALVVLVPLGGAHLVPPSVRVLRRLLRGPLLVPAFPARLLPLGLFHAHPVDELEIRSRSQHRLLSLGSFLGLVRLCKPVQHAPRVLRSLRRGKFPHQFIALRCRNHRRPLLKRDVERVLIRHLSRWLDGRSVTAYGVAEAEGRVAEDLARPLHHGQLLGAHVCPHLQRRLREHGIPRGLLQDGGDVHPALRKHRPRVQRPGGVLRGHLGSHALCLGAHGAQRLDVQVHTPLRQQPRRV
mmetsp:Transcript_23986/g.58794  ORF Transcript_23986/g.58794 Transcript_23986/m.58794 type:complete len:256 (-) Transcript_23986:688-1455(-)